MRLHDSRCDDSGRSGRGCSGRGFPDMKRLAIGRATARSAIRAAVACTIALAVAVPAVAAGLTPMDVAKLSAVSDAVVSPDGRWIAYTVSVQRNPFEDEDGRAWSELHVLDPDSTSLPFVTGEVNVGSIAWTPDGSGISFLAKREGDETRSLYVIPVRGGEARKVLTHDTDVSDYDWHPDGDRVAFLATPDEPKEVEEQKEKGFDAEIYEEELRSTQVWISGLDGKRGDDRDDADDENGGARVLELDGDVSDPHWSPDGRRLALALAPTPLVDDALMKRRVKIVDPETGGIVAEVDHEGKLGPMAWSPDGTRLAMLAGEDLHDPRPAQLMVVPAAGGEPQKLFPGADYDIEDFAWKDDTSLVVVAHRGVEALVATLDLESGGARDLLGPGEVAWEDVEVGGSTVALLGDSARHPTEVFQMSLDGDGGGHTRRTNVNPWLAGVELGEQEVVRWKARDGLELEGLLIRPLDEQPGQRYPLVVVVHGGPESHYADGWLTRYSSPGQVGAAEGYAVFYPNYRGSTGRGLELAKSSQGDPAGKEFDDVVDGVDHLIASGLVDGDKVGVTGGSYGGYATAWMSTYYSERFAAGVMFVGISEKIAKWGASDIPNELNWVHDRHWPWEDWDLMWERSPVRHVEKARTPLLILHGKDDTRVHPSQSLILFRYLKTLGKVPVRLVWYPDEGHGNRKAAHRLDYNLRMMRWFGHYLQGPGGEKPPAKIEHRKEEEPQVAPVTEPGL